MSTAAVEAQPAAVREVRPEAGYEFWNRIGSPKFVVAPMVNQSEMAFRLLCRRYGSDLAVTPMLHSAMFLQSPKYRAEHFQVCPEDRPLIAQFCGDNPQTILAAAKLIEHQVDAIDLNLGCPQGIARRGHYGAFLLHEFDLLKEIVSTLHANLSIPVTCKIRVFDSEEKTIELALLLQNAGAAALTVHGRTRECIKDRIGPCNFDIIKKIKESVRIPVIANGGIETREDAVRCLEYTGVDAVMSSEAILEVPSLFWVNQMATPVPAIQLTREYLALCISHPPPSAVIRPHLFKLLFRHLSVHTDIREKFGKCPNSEQVPLIDEIERRELAMSEEERKEKYANIVKWYSRHLNYKKPKPQVTQSNDQTVNQSNDQTNNQTPQIIAETSVTETTSSSSTDQSTETLPTPSRKRPRESDVSESAAPAAPAAVDDSPAVAMQQ